MQEQKLSEKQSKVLDAIIRYKQIHGFPPTVREICDLTGYRSTSSVASHLKVLKEKRMITWVESMPRTITVRRYILPDHGRH